MIFSKLKTLKIKGRFKLFPFLVCGVDKNLYQLTHFKKRRTCYFKMINFNEKRNSFYINSKNVTKNRLMKLFIAKNETIEIL